MIKASIIVVCGSVQFCCADRVAEEGLVRAWRFPLANQVSSYSPFRLVTSVVCRKTLSISPSLGAEL